MNAYDLMLDIGIGIGIIGTLFIETVVLLVCLVIRKGGRR